MLPRNYIGLLICTVIFRGAMLSVYATPPAPERLREEVPPVLPLFTEAIQKGDVSKVVQILDGNLEQINLPLGEQGWTPLQRSIQYGNQQLVEVLVAQGAKIDLADHFGWTAVHYAAMNGRDEALVFLVEKGADVNLKANQGETPLHWAVNNNHTGASILLVRAGAHLNALDYLGRTPLDIAIMKGHASLQEFLRNAGCLTSQELRVQYDWTAAGKTLNKLRMFQSDLLVTSPQKSSLF